MYEWREKLVLPEEIKVSADPSSINETQAGDGGKLHALLYGEGTSSRPFQLTILYEPPHPGPEPDIPAPARFPTLEEITSAVDNLLPHGTMCQALPFVSQDPEDRPGILGWAGITVRQMGAVRGSPASLRIIDHKGGFNVH